jgi:hypothetical protein
MMNSVNTPGSVRRFITNCPEPSLPDGGVVRSSKIGAAITLLGQRRS